MSRYRKKPVVIEAFRLGFDNKPEWAKNDARLREIVVENDEATSHVLIDTLEGTMHAKRGDYIIKGVHGELYPCKPDIFEETYELEYELKPCPFCGGEAVITGGGIDNFFRVSCENLECGMLVETEDKRVLEDVIREWNTRAAERTCKLEEPSDFCKSSMMTCSECHMKTTIANYCSWCGSKIGDE